MNKENFKFQMKERKKIAVEVPDAKCQCSWKRWVKNRLCYETLHKKVEMSGNCEKKHLRGWNLKGKVN